MRCPHNWAEVVWPGSKTEVLVLGPEMSLVSSAHGKQSRSGARAGRPWTFPSSPKMTALTVFRK